MSEYQFVHFLAVDRPVDATQLEYMRAQSSRARISRWEFTNEYHYGDFHGNAAEMLRRGYDAHLHFADFGIRRLMFRLPGGLPCDRRTFESFCPKYGVKWLADKTGRGGILDISPEADAGSYDHMFDPTEALQAIAPVREELIGGDLRALYLAWLATNLDGESREPPVPAGLAELTPALQALAGFYELNCDLLAAAAERSPELPGGSRAPTRSTSRASARPRAGKTAAPTVDDALAAWIAGQSKDELRQLARRLLGADSAAIRAETLARIRAESGTESWLLAAPTRTLVQLRAAAAARGEERQHCEKQAAEAQRRIRLDAMAANPVQMIKGIVKLAGERSVASYQQAAAELADLREALGPEDGPKLAKTVAAKMRRAYPKRNQLIAALRKQGLLD